VGKAPPGHFYTVGRHGLKAPISRPEAFLPFNQSRRYLKINPLQGAGKGGRGKTPGPLPYQKARHCFRTKATPPNTPSQTAGDDTFT